MATLSDLRNAVEAALSLPAASATLQLNSNTRERAFEAYVFSLLVQAVRQAGGSATIVGIQTGQAPSTVVLRGGPGRLGSRSQDYAYAQCSLGGKDFELHVDVQYEGGSGAIHEVDVSVYDHRTADRVRQNQNEFAKSPEFEPPMEPSMHSRVETDPISPEERRLEIAQILSRAFLRLQQRGCCAEDSAAENAPEACPESLEPVPLSPFTVAAG